MTIAILILALTVLIHAVATFRILRSMNNNIARGVLRIESKIERSSERIMDRYISDKRSKR